MSAIDLQPPAKGGKMSTDEPGPTNGLLSFGLAHRPSTRKLHWGVTAARAGKVACRPSMTCPSGPGATIT